MFIVDRAVSFQRIENVFEVLICLHAVQFLINTKPKTPNTKHKMLVKNHEIVIIIIAPSS